MFIEKLYKDVVKRAEDNFPASYREQNIGWPSEALCSLGPFNVGECGRALFYKIIGVPQSGSMSPRVRKICDAGLMYEDKVIQTFKNSSYYVSDQTRIQYIMPNTTNNVQLSGKLDVIIQDGIKKGIEVKTVSGWKAMGIFGTDKKLPLPTPDNLMQAMLYKHKAMNEEVDGHVIDEIYLMYINREDGCEMYFKIDINAAGYPIITPINMAGITLGVPIELAGCSSYAQLTEYSTRATNEASRLADIRININDVFGRFDSAFSHARAGMLPAKDYSIVYSKEELDRQYHCGRISKIKYNKHVKGEEVGDFKCAYCNYKNKCLEDEGIRFDG